MKKSKHPEKNFRTHSGIEIKKLYTKKDLPSQNQIGLPGQFPFTRGIYPDMYRNRLWTMRQYAGFGTAEESNRRFKYLMSKGQKALSVAFDLPTQCGYDADHSMSLGEVGRVGVSINTVEDMEKLFHDIPLDQVSVSMTINATAPILLAFYLLAAKKRGIKFSKLSGTLQNDILKEYIARGTYIFPPEPSLRLTTDIIEFCSKNLPRWNPISVSGYHLREAGSTAVQEVAFTIADGMEVVKAVLARGLNVDDFAGRLSFFFGCHNHFLEEVAKFRAARKIWATIMRQKFKAKDPRSWAMRFHTQTDGVTLTAEQPDNNLVRTTVQAMAAILGGTQSLHTNAKDEALSIPTEASALTALRIQQVLAHEMGVTNTPDPFGGSWCIESLTEEIEKQAQKVLKRIGKLGGMPRAIAMGYPQHEILSAAYLYQKQVENGDRIIVGVNEYREAGETAPMPIHKASPEIERKQIQTVKKFKAKRSSEKVQSALNQLKRDAGRSVNLMPAILNAAERGATLGEMSDAMRQIFGTHREKIIL